MSTELIVVVVVVGALAFLGGLTALMARPAQIRVEVAGDSFVVEPLGLDRLWCVRARIQIPQSAVSGVRVAARREVRPTGIRLPGSYLPGVITAGSYGTGDIRSFWDVRRADRVLVIDCTPHPAFGYRRLVLEVTDPDATAAILQRALTAHAG